jgi:hypothetical protein
VEHLPKTGRNDPCPCGSGKKFKKCHMGREGELVLRKKEALDPEAGRKICRLPEVHYGRSREMIEALVQDGILEASLGIKCVDLEAYRNLGVSGQEIPLQGLKGSAGILVNTQKTKENDPAHIYMAITPKIQDSTLIHQIAHVLDYLKGSGTEPGTFRQLSLESGIPADHLDHSQEYGRWLKYLRDRFQVQLDAEDAIVLYLYQNKVLLKIEDIQARDIPHLAFLSKQILDFMINNRKEVDALIRDREGYIGKQ